MFTLYKILLMSLRIIGFLIILYGCNKYHFRLWWLIPALIGGIWCFPLYFFLKRRALISQQADEFYIDKATSALNASWLFVAVHFAVQAAITLAIIHARHDIVNEALDLAPWFELKDWAIATVIALYTLALLRINRAVRKDR